MKFFSILAAWRITPGTAEPEIRATWRRDPLAHPAIRAMTEREIADLPFGRPARRSGREAR